MNLPDQTVNLKKSVLPLALMGSVPSVETDIRI